MIRRDNFAGDISLQDEILAGDLKPIREAKLLRMKWCKDVTQKKTKKMGGGWFLQVGGTFQVVAWLVSSQHILFIYTYGWISSRKKKG